MQRRVSIRLNANIKSYTVKIRGCNEYLVKRINSNKACLKLLTCDRILQLIISPIGEEYYTTFYYNLDLRCASNYDINVNFIKRNKFDFLNTFYLTDRIYGLTINGTLNFSKT